jgi:phosphopantothenoylcysteine synthetase/decarboxylase
MGIFADDTLTDEFEAACNDPAGFDFGFEKQREESGFANFGVDPELASGMREKEQARIDAIFEGDEDDFDSPYSKALRNSNGDDDFDNEDDEDLDDDYDDDYFDDDEDEDEYDDDFDDLCDDDDDDFDDVDDWE